MNRRGRTADAPETAARAAMVSGNGWDGRLYGLWILYNSIAFVALLTAGAVIAWLVADELGLALANRHRLAALLVATIGAALFGVVLGGLQWLVVRERIPVPRRRWIAVNTGPALLGWLLVIMPAVIHAENTHESVGTAYALAVSQTLALGPLLGLAQAVLLRKYTLRWAWWIGANLVSWLIVAGVAVAMPNRFAPLDFTQGQGAIAQLYLMLIATTPLTGRALLWVLAPSSLIHQDPR